MKVEFADANKNEVYIDLGSIKTVLPFDMVVALRDTLSGMISERKHMDETKLKKLEATKTPVPAVRAPVAATINKDTGKK